MNKPLLTLLLISIFGLKSVLALDNYPAGARALALSNACVSVSDIWSTFNNQAGIAALNSLTGGIFYQSKFIVDELALVSGAVAFPTQSGTFALSCYQFGKHNFKESKIGLAYAKKITKKVNAGIQFDYFLLSLPENSRLKACTTFEGGISCQATEKLCLGIHCFNPVSAGFTTIAGKKKIPAIFRLGGHYYFDKLLMLTIELEKKTGNPCLLKSGIEYAILKTLFLRLGMSGKPLNFTSGIGYSFNNINTDIGFSYHNNLGITPSVSVQYTLK